MELLITIGLALMWAVAVCAPNCEALATRGLGRQGIRELSPPVPAGWPGSEAAVSGLFVCAADGRVAFGVRYPWGCKADNGRGLSGDVG